MLRVKDVKQMQMADLESAFAEVSDLVVLSPSGVDAVKENKIRLDLRKKDIRLRLVKNNFMRQICDRIGLNIEGVWDGPTMLAWGGASLADLSKELDKAFKGDKNVRFKGAMVDGQPVTFKQALEMPTKEEAIGRVVTLALSPGSRLVGQILGPASTVAGQIKSISENEADGQ